MDLFHINLQRATEMYAFRCHKRQFLIHHLQKRLWSRRKQFLIVMPHWWSKSFTLEATCHTQQIKMLLPFVDSSHTWVTLLLLNKQKPKQKKEERRSSKDIWNLFHWQMSLKHGTSFKQQLRACFKNMLQLYNKIRWHCKKMQLLRKSFQRTTLTVWNMLSLRRRC